MELRGSVWRLSGSPLKCVRLSGDYVKIVCKSAEVCVDCVEVCGDFVEVRATV